MGQYFRTNWEPENVPQPQTRNGITQTMLTGGLGILWIVCTNLQEMKLTKQISFFNFLKCKTNT